MEHLAKMYQKAIVGVPVFPLTEKNIQNVNHQATRKLGLKENIATWITFGVTCVKVKLHLALLAIILDYLHFRTTLRWIHYSVRP